MRPLIRVSWIVWGVIHNQPISCYLGSLIILEFQVTQLVQRRVYGAACICFFFPLNMAVFGKSNLYLFFSGTFAATVETESSLSCSANFTLWVQFRCLTSCSAYLDHVSHNERNSGFVSGQRGNKHSEQIQPELLWTLLHMQPTIPRPRWPGETFTLGHLCFIMKLPLWLAGCLQVEDEMIQCVVCEDWLHGRVSVVFPAGNTFSTHLDLNLKLNQNSFSY